MKTKKEIEKELKVRERRALAKSLPEREEARIETSYEKGYVDALKWVLEKSR